MPRIIRLFLSATLIAPLAIAAARAQSTGCTTQALQLSQQQLYKTIGYVSTSKFPQLTVPPASHWNADSAQDWSSGFFPGWIWYMYEQTLDPTLLTRAQAQTASLAGETTDSTDLNVGFRILSSYGTGYSVTRDPTYLKALQTGANTMASLYVSSAGVINSYPSYDPPRISVIIDNMPGLEILFWGAQNGGNPAWYNMAVSHALKTAQNQVRADGSTYQGVEYNSDGTVYSYFTNDGASADSTWSRGQAWGLYGFTVAYRYTKGDTSPTSPAPTMLSTAAKLADYFIANLPPDEVPVWDFTVPWTTNLGNPPRDSSAAAIAAAALLELSTYMTDPTLQAKYYNAAINIQTSLSSASYLANPTTTDGTLLHGTYSVPGNAGINTSLIWGEYFFPQGCFRAMSPPAEVTNLTASAPGASQVSLSWTAETGAIRYNLKRGTTTGGPYAIIAPPPVLTSDSFTDTTVVPSTTYYYVVSASSVAGEGPNSAEFSVTTPAGTATTTTVNPSANPSTYGNPVTLTATVTSGAGTPTGSVIFQDGGSPIGSGAVNSSGLATFATSSLLAGTHSITAAYGGGGNFSPSVSTVLMETVNKATATTSLSSSANPSVSGQNVTFTASVSPSTATGPVQFYANGSPLGTANLSGGRAAVSTSSLGVGPYSITASYGGDSNYNGSNSTTLTQTVNSAAAATSTTLTSSLNPSVRNQRVTFTATVRSSGGIPNGTVTFLNNSAALGQATLNTSGQATFSTSGLSVGSHSITASYAGSSAFLSSTSAVLTQVVHKR